jgi:NAD(P)-dependent dehydrogenase (short-subunit alcohol dehydrogenase family)
VTAARYPDLAGKTAIVTGAGRRGGLGEAMAHRLAREGVRVVVSDLGVPSGPHLQTGAIGTTAQMQAIVTAIEAAGGTASAVACNMLDGKAIEALVAETERLYGAVDILVNNAGIGYLMKPIVELSLDEWDAVLGVNLRGVFAATQAAARRMIARGKGGRIINIASQAAKSAFPMASAYCASKHGLVGLTRVSALELGPHGITVNAICPNHVTTGLGEWQNQHFAKASGRTVEQYLADMRARIPLGRPGLPEDIADACAFLCSDQAKYLTGEAMNVSGGEEYH